MSRTDYNNSVNEYNSYIRKFPAVMTAKVLGSKPREYFEVTDAAKRDVPTVDFNAAPAVPAPATPAAERGSREAVAAVASRRSQGPAPGIGAGPSLL